MTKELKAEEKLLWVMALCLMLASVWGCKKDKAPEKKTKQATKKAASQPASRPAKRASKAWDKARPQASWTDKRVADAKKRLSATDAGKLIWEAIEAAGGLKRWYNNGPLAYRFAYRPVNGKRIRDTKQVIDTWSSRAKHTHTAKPKWHFGWDGKVAWRLPKGQKQPINARFWALTPYYFVGVPFVFADQGVKLKKLKPIRFERRKYEQVHVSFAAGTGDAPDDYYVVYIDAKTKRVGGVRYVVSYPGFFPKGKHTPEKFMSYDGKQTVGGIHFPKSFRTFKWNAKRKRTGKVVTRSTMSDVAFQPKLASAFFAVPKEAEVLKGFK